MAEFILEIGTEEMPARFVPKLAEELGTYFKESLAASLIDFDAVETYATPRRIAARIPALAVEQRRVEEEVSGPPARIAYDADGNLTKAGQGFAKTQGVAESTLYTVTTDKGEYLAARKTLGGGKSVDILPGLIVDMVKKLSFPKRMRWGSQEFTFGRPMRWLLCMLDDEVVPFEVAELASGNETIGHRVLGRGPWKLAHASEYLKVAEEKCRVVLDPEERKRRIVEQGEILAAEHGGKVVWKPSLLEEVANLVEYPRPLVGEFHEKYLEVPEQVLLTSMESHQKSFGLRGGDGRLLPCFLTTLNMEPGGDVSLVKKGWERVLRARLEDARFFWEADCKTDMNVWVDKLDKVVFLGPLGSMGDKGRRLEKLCDLLVSALRPSLLQDGLPEMEGAGVLAKADLVSEMVYEFDSLQGIMGGIYARRQGKGEDVASAIAEQYLPAGPESPVPSTLSGAILSMADKADTMAGCFGLGKIPTGANDPYALRRCALGISRIVLEHDLHLSLDDLLQWALDGYEDVRWKLEPEAALAKLREFFASRLRASFTGLGYGTLVVDAAIAAGFDDIRALKARIEALDVFAKAEDFEQAVLTFKRAANIIRKQGDEAGEELTGGFDPELLEAEQEKVLAELLNNSEERFEQLWKEDDFAGLLGMLRELRPAVDAFFDNVMVICEDRSLRLNRLNLLKALVDRLGRLADFNALQV